LKSNGNLNALTVAVDYAAETIILKNILLDTGVRYAYVSEIKIYRTKRNEETFFLSWFNNCL
jgi:hypothetical protein